MGIIHLIFIKTALCWLKKLHPQFHYWSDYLFIFSFNFTPRLAPFCSSHEHRFAHRRRFYCVRCITRLLSRDQFCRTLPGASVMESAVKVTSGAANSRWDLRLRGGVTSASLHDWETFLRDGSCLTFLLLSSPSLRLGSGVVIIAAWGGLILPCW